MEIKVTKLDIASGENPVEFAFERTFNKYCVVDGKFVFVGDSRYPIVLPYAVELWLQQWNKSKPVAPFKFTVDA